MERIAELQPVLIAMAEQIQREGRLESTAQLETRMEARLGAIEGRLGENARHLDAIAHGLAALSRQAPDVGRRLGALEQRVTAMGNGAGS